MLDAEISNFAEPLGLYGQDDTLFDIKNILFTLKKAFTNAKIGL